MNLNSTQGRPRDQEIDNTLMATALELLMDKGYKAVSIEGIAAKSGIAKQTIYRRWRSKGEIILDAFVKEAEQSVPSVESDTLAEDLHHFLHATFEAQHGRSGIINRALVSEALNDDLFASSFRERHIAVRRSALNTIFERAIQRGEIKAQPTNILLDLVFGPMWYRLLIGHASVDNQFANQLKEIILKVVR